MPDLREGIIDMLRGELVGPAQQLPAVQTGLVDSLLRNEEILRAQDPPRVRYGAGILFPERAVVEMQEDVGEGHTPDQADLPSDAEEAFLLPDQKDDTTAGALGESLTDLEVDRANQFLPSALGLTALVRVPALLTIRIFAASYDKTDMKGRGWTRRSLNVNEERVETVGDFGWYRRPITECLTFEADELLSGTQVIAERNIQGANGLALHIFSRRPAMGNDDPRERILTITLINRRRATSERARDEECFYQCSLGVSGPDGSACIREYPEIAPSGDDDPEELSLRLLYRHRRAYAVGHGCAVIWPEVDGDGVDWIMSDTLPSYEIKPIVPDTIDGLDLSMLELSADEGVHASRISRRLSDAYLDWIEQQEQVLQRDTTLPEPLRKTGRRHLQACRSCQLRIAAGVELLASDVQVRRAFAHMNRAMLMQQIHYRIASQHTRRWVPAHGAHRAARPEAEYEPPSYEDKSRVWRPFQLAFILMNLESMANPESHSRVTVDVIWFPTGGGKTEAYLGLAAYTILLRRLRNPSNGGTTVLMRYTLRLLTTQQFQRAASLICALEMLRNESGGAFGHDPISIGLWVGNTVTPGDETTAVAKLRALQRGDGDNPFVLRSCPWCGLEMGPVKDGRATKVKGYRELPSPRRVRLVCEDPGCPFSHGDGLPVKVIDEHLYKSPPTLLIGTVDKFALMPWMPDCGAFFGLGVDTSYTPPELVIQDELHLISGPLGSMVGHYETLIDILCRSPSGAPAKIVASTATIARAREQILALYARESAQLFPPQGLRAGESFFAREDADSPGRVYVGVFASGLPSQVTTQVRTLSLLLQAPKSLMHDEDEASLDRYWTLMVYFNSIRELGHAATLVRADIVEYMAAMWERMGISWNYRLNGDRDQRRFINRDLELTSRVASSKVTEVMNDLFVGVESRSPRPVDICLATNMVQVGLDVPRLNLMAVVGQPKTTSEYIQASSRVGRQAPGLVVVILNPSKPRDRSHYEHFRAYHQSIYRYVEPTSVTPFSYPVRQRAMHALIVALVRLWGGERLKRSPDPAPDDNLIERIRSVLVERVQHVDESECAAAVRTFDDFISEWRRVPPSRYGTFGIPSEEVPLMYPAGSQELPEWDDKAWPTPSSMRNVDATCNAQPISDYPGV